jgi:citrate lyase subunit beta / citryl-CoA lyase
VNLPVRSYLYVPGCDERKIEKALAGEADGVVLDLEDAVAPNRKE